MIQLPKIIQNLFEIILNFIFKNKCVVIRAGNQYLIADKI